MNNISCLSLLHQSPTTLLKSNKHKLKLLNQLKFVTQLTIQALHTFYIEKNLNCFDPHIGESLCQIRAYQFITFFNKSIKDNAQENIRQKISELYGHISNIDKEITRIQNIADYPTINETTFIMKFITELDFLYHINEEMLIITLSYFLTIFKYSAANRNFYIDYEKIFAAINTSIKHAKKITHYYQKLMSAYSYRFIEKIALNLVNHNELSNLINLLKCYDDDKRLVLPCYLVTKIILLHICKNQIPIILTIQRFSQLAPIDSITIFFKSSSTYNFVKTKTLQNKNAKNQLAIHIHGIANFGCSSLESRKKFVDRLLSIGLMNLVLANMAAHPQYPGTKLSQFSHNPYSIEYIPNINFLSDSNILSLRKFENEFMKMKDLAQQIGCTLEDPSLLLIEHISCDMISNNLKQDIQKKIPQFIDIQ